MSRSLVCSRASDCVEELVRASVRGTQRKAHTAFLMKTGEDPVRHRERSQGHVRVDAHDTLDNSCKLAQGLSIHNFFNSISATVKLTHGAKSSSFL